MKVFNIINSKSRISSVDIFRCIAIISVVLFHFNGFLPRGFIGVDLFFVISGLLVGWLLTKEFTAGKNINFFKFFLQRGFKIWPSYYFFILAGNLVAYILYHNTNPEQIISGIDIKSYLFFYENYAAGPSRRSFGHIWSLCVEEHFYILLPLMFLIIQHFTRKEQRIKYLFIFVLLTIGVALLLRYFLFTFIHSKDSYYGTHSRIDALGWGVLLNLIVIQYKEKISSARFRIVTVFTGVLIFTGAVFTSIRFDNRPLVSLYFHSITAFSFFLIILGLYTVDFSRLKVLRIIAYYSYNWYLWHPLFVTYITNHLGNTGAGLLTYLVITFLITILATTFIEEPVLNRRKFILNKIFKNQPV